MDKVTIDAMTSSGNVEHETPQDFFDKVNSVFGFSLDVSATEENKKTAKFFSKEQNGLKKKWKGVVWCNPPYGKPENPCVPGCEKKTCSKRGYHLKKRKPGIVDWVQKADIQSKKFGSTVVCLIPNSSSSAWFHDHVLAKVKILVTVRKRLKFGNAASSALQPSVLAIYSRKKITDEQLNGLREIGFVTVRKGDLFEMCF